MKHDWLPVYNMDARQCVLCGALVTSQELIQQQEYTHRGFQHCHPFTARFIGGPEHLTELVLEPPAIERRDGYEFDRWVGNRFCEYAWAGEP